MFYPIIDGTYERQDDMVLPGMSFEVDQIEKRFKDPSDSLKLVIVRDMWLTGFDVPSLHTMYVDKPMKGHSLVQAIARVNRVFKTKAGGLVVDYFGIADDLKRKLRPESRGEALRD